MQRFMARMLNSYRESWNYLLTLSLKIEALDSNPQFIPRIIPLDQIVAYVSMELKVGDMAGVMNFCLPYLVLQSISTQLTDFQWSPTVLAGRGMTEEDIQQLARNVERSDVDVQVELGRTTVSLRDLVALQTGDLILFDKPTDSALIAHVNEREKFRVYPGVHKDRIAVQVADVITSEDE
jgi:flagellar motor switch protein FliM